MAFEIHGSETSGTDDIVFNFTLNAPGDFVMINTTIETNDGNINNLQMAYNGTCT